jgi:tol-pal system protein YbgF
MNKPFVFLLLFSSSIYAEPKFLAPVIDNSTYSNGSVGKPGKPANESMVEVLNRLEQMQQEMQEIRGAVEEQSQDISKLDKRQNNIYSDLDLRLQRVAGATAKRVAPKAMKKIPPVPKKITPAVAVASPVTNDEKIDNPVIVQEKPAVQVKPTVTVPSKVTKAVDSNSPKEQKALYQHAYEMLRNGRNVQAIEGFNKLLTLYPTGKFASNSQYWLGEAYKVTNNLEAAKIAFTKVVDSYGKSYKVPDALLKLGYIELELGNKDQAKKLLTRISRRYPNTTVAHLAKKKLLQLGAVSP